jgi:hypothetical protein
VTTFLEYVCLQLLGPPARPGGSRGESFWPCPFCADHGAHFHTLPRKPGKRDYWRCHRCGAWGDEVQLLKNLRALGDAPAAGGHAAHQELLEQLGREYRRGQAPAPADLDWVERRFHVTLPADYRGFLLNYNGGSVRTRATTASRGGPTATGSTRSSWVSVASGRRRSRRPIGMSSTWCGTCSPSKGFAPKIDGRL